MKTTQSRIRVAVHYGINRLPTDTNQPGQFSITHVFFIITLRRFSCDSYFCFFILIVV